SLLVDDPQLGPGIGRTDGDRAVCVELEVERDVAAGHRRRLTGAEAVPEQRVVPEDRARAKNVPPVQRFTAEGDDADAIHTGRADGSGSGAEAHSPRTRMSSSTTTGPPMADRVVSRCARSVTLTFAPVLRCTSASRSSGSSASSGTMVRPAAITPHAITTAL